MTNRFFLTIFVFAVAGCAGTDPLANNSQISAAETSQVSGSPQPTAAATTSAANANTDSHDADSNKSYDGIEDIESPAVAQTEMASGPIAPDPEPAIVCERVYPTGSIIPVRVCRDRAAAERKTDQDQRIFDHVKRSSAIGGASAASCASGAQRC